ncbi:phosphoribosylanthranilate isomerase [Peptococcaceae bacterium]|nr:phosphoribosylanthranilate isomerase [Peptococcaceae bacterium]
MKICGIKDIFTACRAVEMGADALGFVFCASKRKIPPVEAYQIVKKLPPFVSKVGVFMNMLPEEVRSIAEYVKLDVIQLHGDESPAYIKELNWPVVIKAFRVKDVDDLYIINDYPVQGILLDTYVEEMAGGTGKAFDWNLIKGDFFIDKHLILAGGLTPENVGNAVSIVKPYAVDVSSGVETNGVKDLKKIELFIKNAKRGVVL